MVENLVKRTTDNEKGIFLQKCVQVKETENDIAKLGKR